MNQYYFYCVDEEFGLVCVKFSGYFALYRPADPRRQRVRQAAGAAKAGIGFVSLDNAFAAAVDDVAAVQAICHGLDEGEITALAARLLPCCRTRSPLATPPPGTAMSCRSCRPSSR